MAIELYALTRFVYGKYEVYSVSNLLWDSLLIAQGF